MERETVLVVPKKEGRGQYWCCIGGETSVAYGCETTFTSERSVVERA